MKKKGFTLVELLGVVVILGLLLIIALPPILNQIKSAKGQISAATTQLIENAADLYVSSHSNDYPKNSGNVFCITLKSLVESGNLASPLTDVSTGKEIDLGQVVKATVTSNQLLEYQLVESSGCTEVIPNKPSAPVLVDHLIPVKWNGVEWVKADVKNASGANEWYDYYNKKWANAVTVTATTRDAYESASVGTKIAEEHILNYFVWIPRFKYAIPSGSGAREISVSFESKATTKSTGSATGTDYLTHPAFSFGGTELAGIWVSKFETTGSITQITSKPNQVPLVNQSISALFYAIRNMQGSGNAYGLSSDPSVLDIHMIKSTEWGAVSILTQSKYGRCANGICDEVWNNNNSSMKTGCAPDSLGASETSSCNSYHTASGIQASTTGNIYGVYGMSGGAWEYVLGNYNSIIGSSGFDSLPEGKYINIYTSSTTIKGDAMSADNMTGWYSDSGTLDTSISSWIIRGGGATNGNAAGIFSYGYAGAKGGADASVSTRMTLSVF